jgi:hypothetical protein
MGIPIDTTLAGGTLIVVKCWKHEVLIPVPTISDCCSSMKAREYASKAIRG